MSRKYPKSSWVRKSSSCPRGRRGRPRWIAGQAVAQAQAPRSAPRRG
ncbi:MAG: hypothetical protein IT425_10020 [Pirellulales bacterium]|nr:hypothetical protein [Pirellulales bacterium]